MITRRAVTGKYMSERMEEKDYFSKSVYGDSSWCPLPVSSDKSHSFFSGTGEASAQRELYALLYTDTASAEKASSCIC